MYVQLKTSLELLFSDGYILVDTDGNWVQKKYFKKCRRSRVLCIFFNLSEEYMIYFIEKKVLQMSPIFPSFVPLHPAFTQEP